MFTGIIETVGTVRRTEDHEDIRVLWFDAEDLAPHLCPGESVAVDGACLTVERTDPTGFSVTAVGTTLSRTIAGGYVPGTVVNLERAMALGDRLDGHIVQGHVDGLGTLEAVEAQVDYWKLSFRIPSEVWRATVLHGSIALNGISLTVNDLAAPDRCEVAIIPITWERTNLRTLEAGARVNVEGDLIGKYVGRMLAPHGAVGSKESPESTGLGRNEEAQR